VLQFGESIAGAAASFGIANQNSAVHQWQISRNAVSCEHLVRLAYFEVVSLPLKPSSKRLMHVGSQGPENGFLLEVEAERLHVSDQSINRPWRCRIEAMSSASFSRFQ
jgi:hypothetical protein